MSPFEQIQEYIREYPELIDAVGPPGDAQMRRVKEHFGPMLPDSLEQYLCTFGKLNIPPEEFAGLSHDDPEGKYYDDLVGMHQRLVNDLNMPTEYIPLLSEDGDSYLVLKRKDATASTAHEECLLLQRLAASERVGSMTVQ